MRAGHEYLKHAREIARRWGVRMVEDSGLDKNEAHAQPSQRMVVHAPIDDDRSYVVSMHEIGHVVHCNGVVRDKIRAITPADRIRLVLVEEEAAWDWARANVIDGEWTPGMQAVMDWALKTYTDERDRIASGGGDEMDVLGKMLEDIFGGAPGGGGWSTAPMKPQIPHDPDAVKRRQPVYRNVASSIVDAIKKGGR